MSKFEGMISEHGGRFPCGALVGGAFACVECVDDMVNKGVEVLTPVWPEDLTPGSTCGVCGTAAREWEG